MLRLNGHVSAVLGTVHKLGLDKLIDPLASPERDRILGMIVARLLDPRSKLATARGLGSDTATRSLGERLGLEAVQAEELYAAMDWLQTRQASIEQRLAHLHLNGRCAGAL